MVTLTFRDRDNLGHFDLGSLEIYIRTSVHGLGSQMLEKLLNADGGDYRGRILRDEQGNSYEFQEYRDKELLTVLGPLKVKRAYYTKMRSICWTSQSFGGDSNCHPYSLARR